MAYPARAVPALVRGVRGWAVHLWRGGRGGWQRGSPRPSGSKSRQTYATNMQEHTPRARWVPLVTLTTPQAKSVSFFFGNTGQGNPPWGIPYRKHRETPSRRLSGAVPAWCISGAGSGHLVRKKKHRGSGLFLKCSPAGPFWPCACRAWLSALSVGTWCTPSTCQPHRAITSGRGANCPGAGPE